MSERQRNIGPIGLAALAFWAAAAARMGEARADGAFPSSQSVLLPRDRPDRIVLATTFGLIFTEDAGVTWAYSCETASTRMSQGGQYMLGPAPGNRIYAVADIGAVVSADDGCTWMVGGGRLLPSPPLPAPAPFDVFPDPVDPSQVFVLARDADSGLVSAFRSNDGGLDYAKVIFQSPPNGTITGIESAASAAGTIYLTYHEAPGFHPRLVVSHDAGETWNTLDIEPGVGAVVPSLAAVDRLDERKVYLRLQSPSGDADQFQALAITADGGQTWKVPLKVAKGTLTGFARPSAATVLATGTTAPLPGEAGSPVLFRSEDGGLTFTTEPLSFHALGLAERGGTVFVATNDYLDGFALASSVDSGRTWVPRLRFREIAGIRSCVRATCQLDCDYLAGVKLFPAEVCNSQPPPPPPPPAKPAGCGCAVAPPHQWTDRAPIGAATLGGAIAFVAVVVRRRRSSRAPR